MSQDYLKELFDSRGNLWTKSVHLESKKTDEEFSVSNKLRAEVFKRDNYTCKRCKKRYPPEKLQVHHIIPKSLGGTDALENLETLCIECHQAKHHYDVEYSNEIEKYRSKLRKLFEKAMGKIVERLDEIISSELECDDFRKLYHEVFYSLEKGQAEVLAKATGRRSIWFKKSGKGNLSLAKLHVERVVRKYVRLHGNDKYSVVLKACEELGINPVPYIEKISGRT